jgi:uncharacterized delta-60 repeat protein
MTNKRIYSVLISIPFLLSVGLLEGAQPGPSAAGGLDPHFGNGGKVTTAFGLDYDGVNTLALQADGKIIAAGSRKLNFYDDYDFALARYKTNGSLDSTFGTGGKVTTDFGGGHDGASAVVVQSDGRIIAAGSASVAGISQFALTRYTADGALDASFGKGGKVMTAFGTLGDGASDAKLQPDGKIVVSGYTTTGNGPSDFALARYNVDGTLDRTFGTRGKVTTDFTGRDGASAVALQPDGKIVLVGQATNSDTDIIRHVALARYHVDGTLDASFGTGGKVITGFGTSADDWASDVAIQIDGRIVIAGGTADPSNFSLARYNSDGTLDASFGTGGKVITDFGTIAEGSLGLALQLDGRIVTAGYAYIDGRTTDFAVVRYNVDGTLDTSFGSGGKVTTDFGGNYDIAGAVAIQPDGKIVAAGYAYLSGSKADFALARYLP